MVLTLCLSKDDQHQSLVWKCTGRHSRRHVLLVHYLATTRLAHYCASLWRRRGRRTGRTLRPEPRMGACVNRTTGRPPACCRGRLQEAELRLIDVDLVDAAAR